MDSGVVSRLADADAGEVIRPGSAGWSELAPLYAASGEPMMVVRPTDSHQVATAVRFAADESLELSVRSGGHSAMAFPNVGGLVIDLCELRGIDVDGTRVAVGGGAVWGDVARELGRHGLALSSGDTKSVGVGGLSLGGGIGWLVRSRGLAIDNMVGAEVVLASGEIVAASADEHPDLFWALRGGGGNFGVVTTFVFHAHELDGVVIDHLDFAREDVRGILRGYRDHMRSAQEDLNVTFLAHPPMGPDAEPLTQLIALYPGRDVAAAESHIVGLRDLPGFRGDNLAPVNYVDVLEDDPPPFEGEYPTIVGDNCFVNDFSDECIDALVSTMENSDGSMLMVRYLSGAFNRVPAEATALAHRDAEVFVVHAAFLPPRAPAADQQRVHEAWEPMRNHTAGMYGNFSTVTNHSVVETMYPPVTRERLRLAKRLYDPQNLFHHNHNVAP